ncbi:MAG: hypothetical protein Q8L52_01465 [bacterium]|nr:hypothetical protein [bacterium]
MISPKRSQILGLCVSAVTGYVVFTAVSGFIQSQLDFWYLGKVLGPVLGFVFGGLSAYAMFANRQLDVPLNWHGVSLFLGKPTGSIYDNGVHWVPPLFGIRNTPGPDMKFILKMPGEMFNAQDGALVYFGISDQPEKRNRLQYSVIDPVRYIQVDNPEDELREAYMQDARLFFGQAAKAIGVKNEQTLFSDYIVLPFGNKPDAVDERDRFKARLKKAMFTTKGGQSPTERLFTDESVDIIMEETNAGDFRLKAAGWGIGNIFAFTPSVRENPEAEAADAERQATVAKMTTAKLKADQVKESARGFVIDGKVSPDLAAALAAKLAGENIEIDNKTLTISGLPEVIQALGSKLIDALAKKGGS